MNVQNLIVFANLRYFYQNSNSRSNKLCLRTMRRIKNGEALKLLHFILCLFLAILIQPCEEFTIPMNGVLWLQDPVVFFREEEELGFYTHHAGSIEGSHTLVNWNTPILVTHGEMDYRVPVDQGMAAFNAARMMGVEAKLLLFPEENHWILKPQNSVHWNREFFAWLDKYCKE